MVGRLGECILLGDGINEIKQDGGFKMVKINRKYHVRTKGKGRGKVRKNPQIHSKRITSSPYQEVKKILLNLMHKVDRENGISFLRKYGSSFEDVKIYTNKVMDYETNDDESKGWTGVMPYLKNKPKGSSVVILVTYDGAGHDYFTQWNGYLTNVFAEKLQKRFGDRFGIEHNTNWAFVVYDNEAK
jgi:hypothetical protein